MKIAELVVRIKPLYSFTDYLVKLNSIFSKDTFLFKFSGWVIVTELV